MPDQSTPAFLPPAEDERLRWLSFALLANAGFTDAVGFIVFAGLYVSFMSGDATQLGVKLGAGDMGPAAMFLAAQLLFLIGAGAGRVITIRTRQHRRRVLLAAVAAFLLLAAALGGAGLLAAAFIAAVLGMGVQNAVLHQENQVPVGTMLTGTLVRLGENLVDRLHGKPAPLLDNAGQWLGFVGGATLGAIAHAFVHAWAFLVPAIAAAVMAAIIARHPDATNPGKPREMTTK